MNAPRGGSRADGPILPVYQPKISDVIVGQTIVEVRHMTPEEIRIEGWEHAGPPSATTVFVLSNGIRLYGSADEEGNGPGHIFGMTPAGQSFYTFVR